MLGTVCSGDVTGASTKTLLAVLATATRRPKILQITIGCSGAPADATAIFGLRRITADGTGTAATPQQVDSADGAPTITAKSNYTVEPTYATGDLYDIPLNQRVTAIWNPPFGPPPASNLSGGTVVGLGVQMISGPALAYRVTIEFEE
jgi:hypothetical protein